MQSATYNPQELLDKWGINHFIASTHPCNVGLKNMMTFQVRSQRAIALLLQKAFSAETPVTMTALSHPTGISAVIRDIDEDAEKMIFSVTGTAQIPTFGDQPMLHEIWLDGIRIFFYAALVPLRLRNLDAFSVAIPEVVIRVQRRAHYRVPTRSGEAIHCTIPFDGKTIDLQVINLSGGGIGVLDAEGALPTDIGAVFPNCTLHFPDAPLDLALELRNINPVTPDAVGGSSKLGFRFFAPEQHHLDVIQIHVNKLEQRKSAGRMG